MLIVSIIAFFCVMSLLTRNTPKFGRPIAHSFSRLGRMTGMTSNQIIEKVGAPTSVSKTLDGQLVQWQERGYHMAIRFDNRGVFSGIVHEYAAK
jgi:hypothetical protein